MGMCSCGWNAKNFTGSHVRGCIKASDVGSSGSPDSGIHLLSSAGTKFHAGLIANHLLDTRSLSRNKRLEIDDIEDCRFNQLGFSQSRFNPHNRFVRKDELALPHGLNRPCKTQ
ncbi:hypothetical protein D3C80_1136050 [compost metagenome]